MHLLAVALAETLMTDPKKSEPDTPGRSPEPAGGSSGDSTTVTWAGPERPSIETDSGLAPGHMLAKRYRVQKLLGSGGMADVYQAWDLELDESIAVKVLHRAVASQDSMVSQFKKEIRLARKIVHPNVCRIYDFGSSEEDEGGRDRPLVFVSMELLHGTTLDALPGGYDRVDLDVKIAMFREVLGGLQAAHELGIIHRDLKPQNVMIGPQGHPVIMDFGIARELEAPEITTATSEVIGTPAYMAPERMLGDRADQRTDIYSLGVMLFEMTTGQRPFSGLTVFDMAQNQLNVEPPKPSTIKPDLPEWLEAMIMKLLAKQPADRFQSVAEVLADLPQSERIKTVLLVDDDATMLNLVGVHLNQAGFSVVTARDGGEGIEMLIAKEPDLLCLDFAMPQMDGFQVASYLRQQGTKVPIFMLTGMQDPQYKKQAARLGIEQFFTKPLDIEGFVEAVSKRLASV